MYLRNCDNDNTLTEKDHLGDWTPEKDYQWITLESWFTNLEQTALNHCQPLPVPYKWLLNRTQQHIVYYSSWNPFIYITYCISTHVFRANRITCLPTATLYLLTNLIAH